MEPSTLKEMPVSETVSLDILRERVRAFARERDWEQFHSPKNLAMALIVEAAELVEPFQWLSEAESRMLTEASRQAVAEEIGDVLIYLTRLADVLGIDPLQAAAAKLEINARKYPVDKARGTSRKYDRL
jgi:dCTP diphosphatase